MGEINGIEVVSTDSHYLSFRNCRKARLARDRRYDGLFYSAASTTKIYCRPICPGNPPLESNTVFFNSRAEAEKAGFRPCLRCRPELAPDKDNDASGPFGAPQHGDWQTVQLGFAKMLLTDTGLPLKEIARIAKFASSAEMLDALSNLFGRDPMAFRKPLPVHETPGLKSCALMLAYRPPLDWRALMAYFNARALVGVEQVTHGVYQRSFCLDGAFGWFSLHHRPDRCAVHLEVHASELTCLMQVVRRVRRMLGLDADPMTLGAFFSRDPLLGAVWALHPGLRVPVGWDAFEFAVRAIVGQLVSVGAATKLVGKLVSAVSEKSCHPVPEGLGKVFPGPSDFIRADLGSCGLTRSKAGAIGALAREVASGVLKLERAGPLDPFIKQCTALKGVGDWTAHTIAMRGRGDADAFPASDLGIVKAMSAAGQPSKPAEIRKIAERWRPWRSYAAMLLWMMPRR
jgi:AraC family transcriptional regulator of adaptative response / DNA-3-methyladenine glycosylase II